MSFLSFLPNNNVNLIIEYPWFYEKHPAKTYYHHFICFYFDVNFQLLFLWSRGRPRRFRLSTQLFYFQLVKNKGQTNLMIYPLHQRTWKIRDNKNNNGRLNCILSRTEFPHPSEVMVVDENRNSSFITWAAIKLSHFRFVFTRSESFRRLLSSIF